MIGGLFPGHYGIMNSKYRKKKPNQLSNSGEDCEIYCDLCSTQAYEDLASHRMGSALLLRPNDCFLYENVFRDYDTDFLPRSSILFSLQLPVLPSVLGSRRGSCSTSPDIPEPLDFLVEGESQKKSQTDIGLDTSEQVAEKVPKEVQTSLLVLVTCVRRSAKCRESLQYVSGLHF